MVQIISKTVDKKNKKEYYIIMKQIQKNCFIQFYAETTGIYKNLGIIFLQKITVLKLLYFYIKVQF
jgi:hypothetical protein